MNAAEAITLQQALHREMRLLMEAKRILADDAQKYAYAFQVLDKLKRDMEMLDDCT